MQESKQQRLPLECSFGCMTWACEDLPALALGNGHNPKCAHYRPNVRAISLLAELVKGIREWAAEEDGVPDWLWEPYREAAFVAEGRFVPEEQTP